MDAVKAGRWNMFPVEQELMGQDIAAQKARRGRKGPLVCIGYDEAHRSIPGLGQWIKLAENAALLAHAYILEDGSILPKEQLPHAQKGGNVLEGMYAQGCTTLDQAMIKGRAGIRTQRAESHGAGNNNNNIYVAGPRGVAGYTESQTLRLACMSVVLLDP
jgi:hypothetical protein